MTQKHFFALIYNIDILCFLKITDTTYKMLLGQTLKTNIKQMFQSHLLSLALSTQPVKPLKWL